MKIIQSFKKSFMVTLPAILLISLGFACAAFAASGGHDGPKGWVVTDTYKVLNFAVLAGVLFYIARKPVAAFFSSRIKGIKDELADLEQKKEAARQSLAEYESKLAKLAAESEEMVQEYIRQGEESKKRILAEAEAQAEKLQESAKRNIEYEFKAAKSGLQREIVEKALEQAEILVRESISVQDQDHLVDEYLRKVVAS
ncbi:MAG: ATP synthase F0 subunit B [Desulfamplus sp.]|nr:ATP synthase F0 subunit B [Desulfamplus sp.]